jgi:hypothetical protein
MSFESDAIYKLIKNRPYPLYPLCRDYDELTEDGQRQARLAVLCDHSTPAKFVLAWDFFRRVYLGAKDALFYKKGFQESPPFHFEMIHALSKHGRNGWAAPRGYAKSTVMILEAPLLLALTHPGFEIMSCFSTEKMLTPRFDVLKYQLTQNKLILNDFGVMQPKRGIATWSSHYLQLNNGSIIAGLSVMGKKRGGRPNLFTLDDPEYDPDSPSQEASQLLIEKFELILFKQIIPMLEEGASIFWVGTLISRRSFLHHAVAGDDDRFDNWNRVVLRGIASDPDNPTERHLLWPEKWSAAYLDARKKEIGPSAFASEYCNDPISDQEKIFVIDPRKNEYTVEGDFDWKNPLVHQGLVKWNERIDVEGAHRTYKEFEKPFKDHVAPMFRILLFDYASGLGQYNDYSCIVVIGFDTYNTLWVLDVWQGRAKDDTLERMIYEKGLAWRPRVLGIEAVSIQMNFAEAVQEYIEEAEAQSLIPWKIRVFPITYPARVSKAQRIAGLEWRFAPGRIKYPAHLAHIWPYTDLYSQTSDFTPDLALLPHDDVIDTLSMNQYIVKSRGGKYRPESRKSSLLKRIIDNKPVVPGQPILSGVPTDQITEEMVNVMSQNARNRKNNPRERKVQRGKKIITG